MKHIWKNSENKRERNLKYFHLACTPQRSHGIIIIVIIPSEFFTRTLADGLSLESEWEQISTGVQDSSQYSSRSKQRETLNGIDSSSDFQLFQALSKLLATVPNEPISIGITVTIFHSFLSSLARSKNLSLFDFPSVVRKDGKVHYNNNNYFYALRFFHISVS